MIEKVDSIPLADCMCGKIPDLFKDDKAGFFGEETHYQVKCTYCGERTYWTSTAKFAVQSWNNQIARWTNERLPR